MPECLHIGIGYDAASIQIGKPFTHEPALVIGQRDDISSGFRDPLENMRRVLLTLFGKRPNFLDGFFKHLDHR